MHLGKYGDRCDRSRSLACVHMIAAIVTIVTIVTIAGIEPDRWDGQQGCVHLMAVIADRFFSDRSDRNDQMDTRLY